jgi:hypothetical protein
MDTNTPIASLVLGAADNEVAIVMFAVVGLVAIVAIVGSYVATTARARQREVSRREIAAYVAEGAMTPAEGERLMAAGEKPEKGS